MSTTSTAIYSNPLFCDLLSLCTQRFNYLPDRPANNISLG